MSIYYQVNNKPLRRPVEPGQYTSLAFGQRCREAGIAQSMGSKGDCYDNAVKESFFASLEKDLLRRRSFRTRQQARTEVFDYIEVFYNRERLHSTLGYRSPDEYEHDYYERSDCLRKDENDFIEERAKAA
jgi:putative transposase